jgi:phosphatidylglycerol:prolipoprotein diacylglycerol transferase
MYPYLFYMPDWVPLLGGQPITTFGVMMFLAFLAGGFLMRPLMRREGIDPEKAWDVIFMGVIGGIVGAKLYYVLLNWRETAADPAGMIFSRGGMVWYGGFFGATALIVWDTLRSKVPLGKMADVIAAPLAFSYAIGRMGCFLVGDDYGRPTDLPWGMAFPQGTPPTNVPSLERSFGITVDPALIEKYGNVIPVHPTQLYEVAISTAIGIFLWRKFGHRHRDGWLFMLWLALAGAERFFVEIFRVKDDRFLGPITVAQTISLGLIAVGVWGMARLGGAPPQGAPAKGDNRKAAANAAQTRREKRRARA